MGKSLTFDWINEPVRKRNGIRKKEVLSYMDRIVRMGTYGLPLVVYSPVNGHERRLAFDRVKDMWLGIEDGHIPIAIVRKKKND